MINKTLSENREDLLGDAVSKSCFFCQ